MNKQIILSQPGKIHIEDAPIPKQTNGTALLKVLYGGICGSDLSAYRGLSPYVSYPRIPGHELSAQVVEVGPNQSGIATGMLVTVNPYFNCGTCYPCRNGRVNCCTSNQTMGVQREGGFSEYLLMPVERLYPGRGLGPRELAMVEPFCISYHGVKRAGIKPGENVLVVGSGTIGIMAMLAAKEFGAKVYVADIAEGKLAHAKRMGADGVLLNSDPESFQKLVAEATGGDGFAVTVEAAGLSSTFLTCIDSAAFSGRMVQIGVSKANADFNFTLIQKKELAVFGSRNAVKADFDEVIGIMRKSGFSADSVISAEYDMNDASRAFADFDEKASEMLKIVLRFSQI